MICPNCGYKNPNGSTEHDRCRACRQVMVAPKIEQPKVEKPKAQKPTLKAKTTKKA